jgi:hypothetical protein
VLEALPLDARALAATAILAALPGVLVVRSPWRAVPLLSLAFWVTSWTWPLGGSRTRVLDVALVGFGLLALFRVLRPGPLPRSGRVQMLIVLAAVLLATPYVRPGVPSGAEAPVDAVAAELLAWHDGWPASFEPLSPQRPFEASGLAAIAADVVLLSGAPAHRALSAVTVLAQVTLLLALWSLANTRTSPARAAIVAALGMLPAAAMAEGSGVLATAFAVEAAALWHDRRGHPSAFTAAACVAAAMVTDVATAFLALILAVLVSRMGPDLVAEPASGSRVRGRLRTAAGTAFVLAVPLAWRVPRVEPPDAAALAAVALTGVLALIAVRPAVAEWRIGACGLALVVATGALLGRPPDAVITRDEEAAMIWIRDHSHAFALVCAPDVPAARWIPALSARATTAPLRPGWTRPHGACVVHISLSGLLPPGTSAAEAPAFRAGRAAVWTTSQNR